MSQESTPQSRLEALKKKRPKEGSYETFTIAARGESTVSFRDESYFSEHKRGTRKKNGDAISVTIVRGVEFDVWRECLGSKDGKTPPNKTFHKLIVDGYLEDGEKAYLDPAELQAFLEEARRSDKNRIILWKDRPRPEAEVRLEAALEKSSLEISSRDANIETLRKALKGRGVKDEEIDAMIGKAG